jgi:hypothetical protein
MADASSAKAELNIHKVHEMTIDTNDIISTDAGKITDCDNFIIHNYVNHDCKGYIREISFEELCKAVAKQLVKDGAIPGGE